ncbi:MAG: sigma-54 dependent transcriptional regulator [Leptospiraceae bacterium]|nr:sigma-54 dependent transcriptional regulator [Leptospiraceae bacterium]
MIRVEKRFSNPRFLIIDDDEGILESFSACFKTLGYVSDLESNSEKALSLVQEKEYDLVFIDLNLKPIDGFAILEKIKLNFPDTTVIIVSGSEEIEFARKAVDKGAYHIIKKPIEFADLQFFAKKTVEYHQIKTELRKLREEMIQGSVAKNIITQNSEMKKIIKLAQDISESDINVLLSGESGTGKELLADFIQANSNRKDKPFVKVNCGAIPENLLESELFGHIKGAFTGAVKDRLGRFELANGGTIFLDEIGEMPLNFQVKLLRVLQNKEFESVGDSKTKKVDVRVIAATNINLDEAMKEKAFREDLYYRLKGIDIKIPPLRERSEDIPLLASYFLKNFSGEKQIEVTGEAMLMLRAYRFSGNIRELENIIHRAVVLSKNNKIEPVHLPDEVRFASQKVENELISLEELEKIHIKKVLQKTTDYKEAAHVLGIDLTTLWRKRKRYRLE